MVKKVLKTALFMIVCMFILSESASLAKAKRSYVVEDDNKEALSYSSTTRKVKVGDNVYAQIDDNGTVTISGSGAMWPNKHMGEDQYDFTNLRATLVEGAACPFLGVWRDEIKKIVFGEGVTSIGKNACRACGAVGEAKISDGPTGIIRYHNYCAGLPQLSEVQISNSVKKIEQGAFFKACNLTKINIPSSVTEIQGYAFYCSGLESIKFSDKLEKIGQHAFDKTNITEVTIPSNVVKIGTSAFPSTVTTVTVNDGTKLIGKNAFQDVKATIYSKDVTIMRGGFGKGSEFLCYRNSTADKYAKQNNIFTLYLDDTPEQREIAKIKHDFSLSENADWQSVYYVKHKVKNPVYVQYGDLLIARNFNKIYVKKEDKIIEETTRQNRTVYGKQFGTTLTNGQDIIYQSGKNIYLWKNVDKKIKIAKLAKTSYILIAVYGDYIFYQKDVSRNGSDYTNYRLYRYDMKTKKTVETDVYNAYYSNGYYIVNSGENKGDYYLDYMPLYIDCVYEGEYNNNGEIEMLAGIGQAAMIADNMLYYTKSFEGVENRFGLEGEHDYTYDIIQRDLKTGDETTLKCNISEIVDGFIDKDRYYCYDEKSNYLFNMADKTKIEF